MIVAEKKEDKTRHGSIVFITRFDLKMANGQRSVKVIHFILEERSAYVTIL